MTLCYYGYRDIKKPISGTFCTQINVDVVYADSISFFGDGTYMDTNAREYKTYTESASDNFTVVTLDKDYYAVYDYKDTVYIISPDGNVSYYTRIMKVPAVLIIHQED